MAPEMKKRKTVSLNAIVANNAFSEGRGKSRGSAKAVKRERVSETGSARRRGPRPRGDRGGQGGARYRNRRR